MREIKFRAWDSYTREMLFYGFEIFNEEDNGVHSGYEVNNGNWIELDLMQYTGLNDKNGIEIYESDILKSESDFILSVEFFSSRFNVVGFDRKLSDIHDLHYYIERLSSCEVIGNIYENGGLLDGN